MQLVCELLKCNARIENKNKIYRVTAKWQLMCCESLNPKSEHDLSSKVHRYVDTYR